MGREALLHLYETVTEGLEVIHRLLTIPQNSENIIVDHDAFFTALRTHFLKKPSKDTKAKKPHTWNNKSCRVAKSTLILALKGRNRTTISTAKQNYQKIKIQALKEWDEGNWADLISAANNR